MSLRVVFMGTPEFSVPVLEAIHAAGHAILAAYSQPPRPAGRGMSEQKSPVQQAAEAHGIPVLTPSSLKDAAEQARFAGHGADVAVVVAYGLLLPPAVLAAPRHGCLNLHASALPRWRGAAPIQRAIMAGDTETAVAVMRMEAGLDTGPVCLAEPLAIAPGTTAGELHDEMARRGASLMTEALLRLEGGGLRCIAQPAEGVTYARKIGKSETEIDFRRPAREVLHHVHGLSPAPGAWLAVPSADGKSERLRILRVELAPGRGEPGEVLDDALTIACSDGAIRVLEAQRAGKKPMPAGEVLRGFSIPKGARIKLSA